ncbi:MAG: hypothetical protein ACT4P7_10280 [Gemmatimonadaceae bacterium]
MRRFALGALCAIIALPSIASAQDADRTVAGGITVSGWKGKIDDRAAKQGKTTADSKFDMASGKFRMQIGPAAIYWNDANAASGNYEVKSSITENKMSAAHPHSYGVFIGGADLGDDAKQTFVYCIVYGTGKYSVKYFHGAQVVTLVNMAEHAAINKVGESGSATNEIGWRVKGGNASCVVNGQEIKSFSSAELVGADKLTSTNGKYGFRVSHNLDLTATPIALSKQ